MVYEFPSEGCWESPTLKNDGKYTAYFRLQQTYFKKKTDKRAKKCWVKMICGNIVQKIKKSSKQTIFKRFCLGDNCFFHSFA